MKVDYIVVGSGLAGFCFCEELRAHDKTFAVFDDGSQQSSIVAAGLYNPVVLKRFTPVWKCKEQLEILDEFYGSIENRLGIKINHKIPVYRQFKSLEEQNNWFIAADKPFLNDYLSTNIVKLVNKSVSVPFGFGIVNGTGRIDVNLLITHFKKELKKENRLLNETFDYHSLKISADSVSIKNITANQIVFAEGFGVKRNPFFKHLPLTPTKGELLIINAPNLNLDYVLKSSVFIVPIEDHKFIVGATYNWEDFTNTPTQQGKRFLIEKLTGIINVPFDIVDHVAGVRPTVKGRKPLVGRHPKHNNVYILNGLGTRGTMIGPYVAKQLFNYIEYDQNLDKEINIARFGEA